MLLSHVGRNVQGTASRMSLFSWFMLSFSLTAQRETLTLHQINHKSIVHWQDTISKIGSHPKTAVKGSHTCHTEGPLLITYTNQLQEPGFKVPVTQDVFITLNAKHEPCKGGKGALRKVTSW